MEEGEAGYLQGLNKIRYINFQNRVNNDHPIPWFSSLHLSLGKQHDLWENTSNGGSVFNKYQVT